LTPHKSQYQPIDMITQFRDSRDSIEEIVLSSLWLAIHTLRVCIVKHDESESGHGTVVRIDAFWNFFSVMK
jgi:hypothetical protein